MKEHYDFSKGVKNPYADKLKDGYSVTVHYGFNRNEDDKEQVKQIKEEDSDSCSQMKKSM